MKIFPVLISLFLVSCAINVKDSVYDSSDSSELDKVIMEYYHGIFISAIQFEKQALLMAIKRCKKFGYKNAKHIKTIELRTTGKRFKKRSAYECLGVKDDSVSSQIAMIRDNLNNIKKIKNPSEETQLLYLKLRGHPENLRRIENMSENVQLSIVSTLASSIVYIKNPTEKIQLYSVKKDAYHIKYIKNPTEKVQIYIVENAPAYIIYIKNLYPSVKKHPKFIEYQQEYAISIVNIIVSNSGTPTNEQLLSAIRQDPSYIQYINNPSEEIQLEALKKDPSIMRYIKNPTKKVIKFMQ